MQYPVVETFQSIQGEGHFAGTPANFIRLAGCPNGCKFCDTNIRQKEMRSEQVLADRMDYGLPMVVITGGEPCIHPLEPLIRELNMRDGALRIHLETSGVRHITNFGIDWVSLAPKKGTEVIPAALQRADEVKWLYPMWNLDEIARAARGCKQDCLHYVQPINYKTRLNHENISQAVAMIIHNPYPFTLRLSVQMHKVIHVR